MTVARVRIGKVFPNGEWNYLHPLVSFSRTHRQYLARWELIENGKKARAGFSHHWAPVDRTLFYVRVW